MGFNKITLLSFVFGMLLPAVVIIVLMFLKKRKNVAFDSISYGFVAFFASIVAVFVAFTMLNSLFLSNITFDAEKMDSGLTVAAPVFSAMILVLFAVCEISKIKTIQKFSASETKNKHSGVGFAIGILIAQNAVVFAALNMLEFNMYDDFEITAGFALFSGAMILVTGIMYTALSYASEVIIEEGGKTAPAYALSLIYYLFWIGVLFCINSTTLMYVVSGFVFAVSLILSGVFIVKAKKSK